MALRWREEGAQIVGGCCGVRPEHIAAAARRLAGTAPGHRRPTEDAQRRLNGAGSPAPVAAPEPWTDRRRRALYPLPFPDLSVEPGVAAPGAASYMAWRYVFSEGIGAHQRCLDIGCGTGILAVQLALNGAAHVRALDIDDRAVANTLANAFRNDVADRVTAETVDLFPWVPEERYEVVVASLYQKPTDPFARVSSHRLPDYWGRNLVDQLIAKLSEALAPEGVAYVVQLSILSQRHTADALAAARLRRAGRRLHAVLLPARAGGEPGADRARRGAQRRLPPDRRRGAGDGGLPARGQARAMTATGVSDADLLDELRERVAGALEGSAEDVLAAHRALTAALDADPSDAELRRLHRELVDEGAIARLHGARARPRGHRAPGRRRAGQRDHRPRARRGRRAPSTSIACCSAGSTTAGSWPRRCTARATPRPPRRRSPACATRRCRSATR